MEQKSSDPRHKDYDWLYDQVIHNFQKMNLIFALEDYDDDEEEEKDNDYYYYYYFVDREFGENPEYQLFSVVVVEVVE